MDIVDIRTLADAAALQCVAGAWRSGRGGAETQVVDPASEALLARVPAASASDIGEALEAATAGFDAWRRRTPLERAGVLRRGAALLRARAGRIALLLTAEQGKPLAEAQREVEQAADTLEWHADEGRRVYGRVIGSRWPGTQFHTQPEPIGPVAAFTPWNFPLMLSAIKVGAALAAGCAVILKPADETPFAAAEMVHCLNDAGLPAGALQMLVGVAGEISSALIASEAIRKVSFTGSTAVGRLLAAQCGERLKPITLELGGHAPVVVCDDADIDAAVRSLAAIKFRNAGQICANPSRFFVQRAVAGRFIEAYAEAAREVRVGPGTDPRTTMGPLANRRRRDAVEALVADAREHGARLVCGGHRVGERGWYYAPTVLADVPDDAHVMREEPFGPVVPVAAFDTLDEAIARANALDVGLAAFGYTRSMARARRLGNELRAGAVGLNCVTLMQPETPFGGVRDSGFGRENGSEGLASYLSVRTVATAA
ncbi:MAG: NAD-dependent succinate-semialdehyde dehydrogenase [Proteobacteria bacterium]|nr:NAD-dependent succinate-semialdehyde dehydrogenase [Pseudomonadota bacterium]